ncbi:MAG: hypothetical protein ACYDDO_06235 [Acidiferrobacterales bacterium]
MLTELMAKWNSGIRARYLARSLRKTFFERFPGQTIPVHGGLHAEWVVEILKESGGDAHMRFDRRQVPSRPQTLPTGLSGSTKYCHIAADSRAPQG